MTVLGYRLWNVNDGFLEPLTRNGSAHTWVVDEADAGHCRSTDAGPSHVAVTRGLDASVIQQMSMMPTTTPVGHPAPQIGCRCGLYAYKTPQHMMEDPGNAHILQLRLIHTIIGVVTLSGRAIEHAKGWRAERASIRAICDPNGHVGPHYEAARYTNLTTMFSEWYVPEED